ncbi:MAG: iron-containing alcohol dehydrogenase [Angelakisella sp.]
MNFQFHMPVKFFSEQHAVENHKEEFSRYGNRCLIVTGASSAKKSGALDDVTGVLTTAGIQWKLFDEVGQNPLLSVCHRGGAVAAEFQADFIVGIGGGSPLDAAKAIAVFAANPTLPAEDIYSSWEHPALPILLVGTTAGTGSEVTKTSVLTIDRTGHKVSWGSEQSYAKASFGDPRYTQSLPIGFTMSTGLDAVSHALEAYFSNTADSISDMFAIESLKILLPTLKTVWATEGMPTMEQRTALYDASIYAGFALNRCGMVFCHLMGYYLSEEAGIPHGYACAAFLPALIDHSVPLAPHKARRLFGELGIYAQELKDTIAMLTEADFTPISDQKLEQLLENWKGSKNIARTLGTLDTAAQRKIAQRVLQKRFEGEKR